MKKILTIVLVIALCVALPAFAAEPDIGADNGTDSVEVNGVYEEGEAAAEIISVDISWGTMVFTYNDTVEGTWDHEQHRFNGTQEANWTCEENANKITVINHSNTAVDANLTFTAAQGPNIVGAFDEASGTEDDNKLELATAVNTAVASAPSADAFFNITSGSIADDATLGTITVKIVSK